MELIPVSKNGEYIEVHPTTLAQHKNVGWQECEKQHHEDDAGGGNLTSAQIKEQLKAAKIEFPSNARKPELEALLASILPVQ